MARKHWFLGILLLLAVCTYALYHILQPVWTYDHFPLADGNKYLKIYEFFKGERADYAVRFPFHSRIFVPWLSSILPGSNPIISFKLVNLLFVILSTISLYAVWKRVDLPLPLIFAGFFWLFFHWTGMIRLNLADPLTVDLPLYFFPVLLLLIIQKGKYGWLILLGPIATLQKESFIPLLLVLWIYACLHNYIMHNKTFPLWSIGLALVLSIFTKILTNWYFAPIESGRNSIITLLFHAREVLLNPFKLMRWLAAFIVAFGFFPFAALFQKISWKWDKFTNLLILFSLASLTMSLLGGDDYTRLIFLSFPFFMTLLLTWLREVKSRDIVVLLLLSAPLTRFWQAAPDPAFQWKNFSSWYPEFASWPLVLAYAGLGIIYFLLAKTIFKKTQHLG